MTFERPPVNPNEGKRDSKTVYDQVFAALQTARQALFVHYTQNRGSRNLDERLVELYELRPVDLPELNLPDNLAFGVDGFAYVASHWYPLVRAVGSGRVKPEDEEFFNEHLARMLPDAHVTISDIRESLAEDASGASWLEQQVRAEFRQGNLSSLGARCAITGIRKLHEALASAA